MRMDPEKILKHPAWFRHGLTVVGLGIAGVIAWNDLGHVVNAAGERSQKNEKSIEELTRTISDIDKKQGIVIQRLDSAEQKERERALEALRRHNETGRALERIFDKLDNNK